MIAYVARVSSQAAASKSPCMGAMLRLPPAANHCSTSVFASSAESGLRSRKRSVRSRLKRCTLSSRRLDKLPLSTMIVRVRPFSSHTQYSIAGKAGSSVKCIKRGVASAACSSISTTAWSSSGNFSSKLEQVTTMPARVSNNWSYCASAVVVGSISTLAAPHNEAASKATTKAEQGARHRATTLSGPACSHRKRQANSFAASIS